MIRRQNRQNEIAIDLEDARMIMGEGYPEIEVFINSTFCRECNGSTTIVNFDIFLDDTHDIIMDGECIHCNKPVSRYIETGESGRSTAVAKHIRAVHEWVVLPGPGHS